MFSCDIDRQYGAGSALQCRRTPAAAGRGARGLTWSHLSFLLAVTLLPFSTGLLAQDITYRLSIGVYWMNLFALGAVLLISIRFADRTGLVGSESPADMRAAMKRRIVVYQGLYLL